MIKKLTEAQKTELFQLGINWFQEGEERMTSDGEVDRTRVIEFMEEDMETPITEGHTDADTIIELHDEAEKLVDAGIQRGKIMSILKLLDEEIKDTEENANKDFMEEMGWDKTQLTISEFLNSINLQDNDHIIFDAGWISALIYLRDHLLKKTNREEGVKHD